MYDWIVLHILNNIAGSGCLPLNIMLRLMGYLAAKLTMLVVIGACITLAAFTAYDVANIYVVLQDGMNERAAVVLKQEDPSQLDRFFTLRYLNSDPIFQTEQYQDYIIRDYDYKLSIQRIWVWPWQDRTKVTVEEHIPTSSFRFDITDALRERLTVQRDAEWEAELARREEDRQNAEALDDDAEDETETEGPPNIVITPPQWQNGVKMVEFRKVDRKWKIDRVIFVGPLS